MTNTPFYGMNAYNDGAIGLPAFANSDNARSGFWMSLTAGNGSIYYYDEDGAYITSGVWSSGIAPSENHHNDSQWLALYMDTADNVLYMVSMDTTASPHSVSLSKVDKSGTLTNRGTVALGNASMNYSSNYWLSNYTGAMYRSGGDGSGTFIIPFSKTAGGNAAAGVPNRGVNIILTDNNDGSISISYSSLFGDNFANPNALHIMGGIGPTANNIYGGPFAGAPPNNILGIPWQGFIVNTSTGRGIDRAIFDPEMILSATSTIKAVRWRSQYHFSAYSAKAGPTIFDEVDMHNYIDEMAVYYGIL
jgi:hypothetical protein